MTRGSDIKPVRRVLSGWMGQEYVVELRRELIVIRPLRSRRGGKAEICIKPGAIYARAFGIAPRKRGKR